MRITIKKGLDIPIEGQPEQTISDGQAPRTVAAVASDVSGLLPRMAVQVGDRVRLGQALYRDKRNPEVPFTAPGAGEVIEINRGARRALQSVVIRLDGNDEDEFKAFAADTLPGLDRQEVRDNLIAAGLWTTFRTRPFSRIPAPDATPAAIFVTAMDTRPLAIDPAVIVNEDPVAFRNGLQVVSRLPMESHFAMPSLPARIRPVFLAPTFISSSRSACRKAFGISATSTSWGSAGCLRAVASQRNALLRSVGRWRSDRVSCVPASVQVPPICYRAKQSQASFG
jgi:Na+-transporting NADH:ubiquinone oxidoreductase subunit A